MTDWTFSKLNGQGNDFVLMDGIKQEINLDRDQIIHMCDRHFGIGADGIIVVRSSKVADFKMDYYNADGSVAEMCGNGIRCMARFIWEKGLSRKLKLNIETLAGIKGITIDVNQKRVGNIRVNMGAPSFSAHSIPADVKRTGEVFGYNIKTGGQSFKLNLVSMGNPHCVILLDHNEDLERFEVKKWGPLLENHPLFPQKTNVEFIKIKDKQSISMRAWERGVGQTLACGTGACASAVAAIKLGKLDPGRIQVDLAGGTVYVTWTEGGDVYLEGTTDYVFDGNYLKFKEGNNL
ncbi:MAG: diaminopimelate epimerase [Actinomycetota bacterium]|nr:diaminopimelate epimerase [Actinomycetota bacterium]